MRFSHKKVITLYSIIIVIPLKLIFNGNFFLKNKEGSLFTLFQVW
jgi:hypothetical protein